jgi:hypothetical protein
MKDFHLGTRIWAHSESESNMKDFLLLTGLLIFWVTLNRWILPWFGIPTCMSGGCCPNPAVRGAPAEQSTFHSDRDRCPVRIPADAQDGTE